MMTNKKNALERHHERLLKEQERPTRPARKNGKPELQVQREVMAWFSANGFSCQRIESKGTWSHTAGRWTQGQITAGTADIIGVGHGFAVFCELKAKGRRNTLKPHQRDYLITKIEAGAFACVTDGVDHLKALWNEFRHRHLMEPRLAKNLLLRNLPTARERGCLFDES